MPHSTFGLRLSTAAWVTLIACALAGPAVAAPAAGQAGTPARAPRTYTIQQFLATTTLYGASFSHDEQRILFSSDQSGVINVYAVPVEGGTPVALTRSTTDNDVLVSAFPKDARFLHTRDQGGNENNHLYVTDADGRERDLTPGDKLKATFGGWTRDGDAFYVLTNERDPRFFDIYRVAADGYERTLAFRDTVGYQFGGVSKDGKWIAFTQARTTLDSDVYVWSAGTGEMKLVSRDESESTNEPADFDGASRWLYYLTNDGSEFTYVRRYELATGKVEEVERADWDILVTRFSPFGKYRATAINADASTQIRVVEAGETERPVSLPPVPDGDIVTLTFPRSESKLAFYVNGDRSPSDLYVLDLAGGAPRRLTTSLNPEIDASELVAAEVVRFPSFDGMRIPNLLYKPHGASAGAKVPALVWVHGGPGDQQRRGYNALIQYLVNHGYAVLGINNRGSSGYGKTFFAADDRKHGREPLWDCVEGKKWLAAQPWVDSTRVAILGGSYGGYMVLAALAYQPEVFRAGVDIFGVSNWLRTLRSIPPYWESFRQALYRELGDPAADSTMLREISPVFHADRIRRPLLVLQGANDPRVLQSESDDIVAAVKANGVPVEYVIFPDEGHGFRKTKNRETGYVAVLKFLDTYVKGDGAAAAR